MFNVKMLSIVSLCALLSACASTTNNSVSGVQRSQLLLLPSATVDKMSAQSYTQTLQAAEKKNTLNADKPLLNRVSTISHRLIAQVAVFRPDAAKWKWEVNVEKNDQLNAYCMPGGKIMMFSGLAEKLNATDDELAAVIGHEIAHALREHGRERMSQAYIQQFGLQALAAFVGGTAGSMAAQGAGMGSQLLFSLPNGREQEREADRMGLELAARAGYNPEAAVSLWKKMMATNKEAPPEFLSTHPSSENRIKDLQALTPKVMPFYLASKSK
ncbi:M48 family metallopeptidase [Methylophilus medardicus]|uniref:M48 family metallopeptidase n=1 Tax=Methylophilus medardicus TaxID=2588534 RepID=A0A5B8CR81_9PROT|nr:M48 family metallopeptidase [Methylophilus medardicus]QDC43772.1 M48 family metallopeptidase [Methylophilus medardicus]QDC48779.1 M48 family metallopeptidase [Methylophilus medardicus]QDC52484.1 M48 family metallopeptidase [Methylophilus medardicus]